MPYYDGPRRLGRFLKKGSKVMDRVSLMDFSFEEINDAQVIDLDNSNRTIVHSQYHSEGELAATVHVPERFNVDLVARDQKRTVILPMDFTKEWERDRRSRKDRASQSEEDEFDFEYDAAVRMQERQQGRAAPEAQPQQTAEAPLAAPVAAQQPSPTPAPVAKAKAVPTPAPAAASPKEPVKEAPKKHGEAPKYESMDVVGKAIKNLMVTPEGSAAEFIPVNTKTESPDAAAVEDVAAMSYKQRVEQQQIDQKKLDELVEEAKAKGYRDGFGVGEEKGELQVRQNAQAIFGKMAELMHEFGNLKHEILDNVQQNFYELCQAMAESLIKREFSIHPDAFVTVLRRAIAEAVEPGKFKIRVHPEFFEKLSTLGDQEIREALVKDLDVEPGDFKIESNMSVVDVSVKKMISDLLSQADLSLFQKDKDDKAS